MTNNDELAYREKHSRLWDRYDEAAHDNAEHMRDILQLTLDSLEAAERRIVKTERDAKALLSERDADKKLIAELEATAAHSQRGWNEAHEQESRAEARELQMAEINDALCKLLPDCRYMDPPDGGQVEPLEQVARMVEDYRQRITELEARELVLIVPPRRCFDYAALAVQERDEQWHKALHDACKRAGIKLELGE